MSSEETRVQCQAQTKSGQRCKLYARPDSDYCSIHQPAEPEAEHELSEEELRQELVSELDELTERVQSMSPEYKPPPFSPRRLMAYLEEALASLPRDIQLDVLGRVRAAIGEGWFGPDTLKSLWYMLNYTVKSQADLIKRRYTGEYDTDEWGLDWEFLDAVLPFFRFMYKRYWRVETTGFENVPDEGRALLVANHSGQVPWDGTMITTAVLTEHPSRRLVRGLYAYQFPAVPFFSHMLVKTGQTLADLENGIRLLEQDELVAVYPEGYKGVSKLYKDRYRLARFGRGGFVKMAMITQAPIVPISVVGAEETYVALGKSPLLARLMGLPWVPITPTLPWLGLLGLVPLPTKWYIDFGEPVPLDAYGADAADNVVLISQLTDHIRNIVQEMVHTRLAHRRSIFLG
jgi:1-acyl-sn-glycerol-3-phosphate acyltransferase